MKQHLKRWMEAFAPAVLDAYRSIKSRRMFARRFGQLHNETHDLLYKNREIEVLSGPFRGLKYFKETVWGSITPKWLGSYELELHDIIEEIIANDYAVLIDIGCAEGYYAIGLAYRMRKTQVFAYDSDFISRRQTARLAALNHLESQVSVFGYCTSSEIQKRFKPKTLIVCDIEGYERELLDPVACPILSKLDLLVELHEAPRTSSTLELLKIRFFPTHTVREITATDRLAWSQSIVDSAVLPLSLGQLREASNESRDEIQKWLWLEAR